MNVFVFRPITNLLSFLTAFIFAMVSCFQVTYAQESELMTSKLRTQKNVRVNWYSLETSLGNIFELPTDVKKCSLLKVQAIDSGYATELRVGSYMVPQLQKLRVVENINSAEFKVGQVLQVGFYAYYKQVFFGGIYYPNVTKLPISIQDKREPNTELILHGQQEGPPQNKDTYVCIVSFDSKSNQIPLLSYFLSDQ